MKHSLNSLNRRSFHRKLTVHIFCQKTAAQNFPFGPKRKTLPRFKQVFRVKAKPIETKDVLKLQSLHYCIIDGLTVNLIFSVSNAELKNVVKLKNCLLLLGKFWCFVFLQFLQVT